MLSSLIKALRVWTVGAGLAAAFMAAIGTTAPATAQERLEQDFGVIQACAGDVWRLCSDVLPDIGRMKACMQDKMGQLPKACLSKLLDVMAGSSFKVCQNQTYALCASARCNVYDGVAYCQCEVKKGNSISLPFPMHKGDVCEVNAKGPINRYMVSTYSLPEELIAPNGKRAIYHCGGGPSEGAYAQCDGGMCFASTEGKSFPGFDKPIPKGQIICACPITTASGAAVVVGHEIMGPYPCDKSYFKYCVSDVANTKTGSTIYVGAPIGTAAALTALLTGKPTPPLNECGSE